jgi:hypothetical protein
MNYKKFVNIVSDVKPVEIKEINVDLVTKDNI